MFDAVAHAFVAETPADPPTPVVLSVPHAGISTAGFERTMVPELEVRSDADLFVDRLYRAAETDGPPVYVAARLSRFVCDLNRHPDDVSRSAVPEHPAPRNADGRGFIWAVTTNGTPALSRPLTLGEWRDRTAVHAAYHDAIAAALDRARGKFGFAILVDGHSMPSRGRSGHSDTGRARAHVVPGDREGRSCAASLSRLVRRHFEDRGLEVRPNDPYKGGFITAHHGRPAENVHAIQIELRRDLYMDEAAFAPIEPGFSATRRMLGELLETLATFRP
jgi:N-formylglutamate amidohydrolase